MYIQKINLIIIILNIRFLHGFHAIWYNINMEKEEKIIDKGVIKVYLICCDITSLTVDIYVNAANNYLAGGGGVDYAIHKAAGEKELIEYNKKVNGGYLKTGEVTISPGFKSKAKYIIHTVGPVYFENNKILNEKLLYSCYYKSLELAKKYNAHSIAFPAISQGVYGYPANEAAIISLKAINDWILENKEYELTIYLVAYLKETYFAYLSNAK